ncbi:MAG: hypothetical protein R2856_35385 [Caldilineaceae bacterium]
MGIDDDAFGLVIPHTEDDVGRLARHAGEAQQIVHSAGTSPPKSWTMVWAASCKKRAFWRKKPVGRMISSTSSRGGHQIGGCWVRGKEDRRHPVYGIVGTLRRQDRRREQL